MIIPARSFPKAPVPPPSVPPPRTAAPQPTSTSTGPRRCGVCFPPLAQLTLCWQSRPQTVSASRLGLAQPSPEWRTKLESQLPSPRPSPKLPPRNALLTLFPPGFNLCPITHRSVQGCKRREAKQFQLSWLRCRPLEALQPTPRRAIARAEAGWHPQLVLPGLSGLLGVLIPSLVSYREIQRGFKAFYTFSSKKKNNTKKYLGWAHQQVAPEQRRMKIKTKKPQRKHSTLSHQNNQLQANLITAALSSADPPLPPPAPVSRAGRWEPLRPAARATRVVDRR